MPDTQGPVDELAGHIAGMDEHLGRLESEAPNSVTLRDAAGEAHTILRANVESMTAATSSLMPVGLDQAMSAQQLADLIAYLKSAARQQR